jgi:hypothetical protein
MNESSQPNSVSGPNSNKEMNHGFQDSTEKDRAIQRQDAETARNFLRLRDLAACVKHSAPIRGKIFAKMSGFDIWPD